MQGNKILDPVIKLKNQQLNEEINYENCSFYRTKHVKSDSCLSKSKETVFMKHGMKQILSEHGTVCCVHVLSMQPFRLSEVASITAL